jgi:hypothetical protein
LGPFTYLKSILELKKKHKKIKIILDYRDPWSNNTLSFGIKHLSNVRKKNESIQEQNALKICDGVIGVSKEIYLPLIEQWNINVPNQEISNGIREFAIQPLAKNQTKIRVFFAGTLYEDIDDLLLPWLNELEKVHQSNPNLFQSFEWHWFGDFNPHYRKLISEKSKGLSIFHEKKTQNELNEIIADFDISLNFIHRDFCYSRNTKFYESLENGKKILLVSWYGRTTQIISEKSIGFVWNPSIQLIQVLTNIEIEWKNNALGINTNKIPDLYEFTFKSQAHQLLKFIDQISHA